MEAVSGRGVSYRPSRSSGRHHRLFVDRITDNTARKQLKNSISRAGALQKRNLQPRATSRAFATDAKGVIQIFNVGAERMLGYKPLRK